MVWSDCDFYTTPPSTSNLSVSASGSGTFGCIFPKGCNFFLFLMVNGFGTETEVWIEESLEVVFSSRTLLKN